MSSLQSAASSIFLTVALSSLIPLAAAFCSTCSGLVAPVMHRAISTGNQSGCAFLPSARSIFFNICCVGLCFRRLDASQNLYRHPRAVGELLLGQARGLPFRHDL